MIETLRWFVIVIFGVWALLLCACLIYLGRLYFKRASKAANE